MYRNQHKKNILYNVHFQDNNNIAKRTSATVNAHTEAIRGNPDIDQWFGSQLPPLIACWASRQNYKKSDEYVCDGARRAREIGDVVSA